MASPMKSDRRERFRKDTPAPKPEPKKGKEAKK